MSDHEALPAAETDEKEVSHASEGWAGVDDANIETFDGTDDEAIDADEPTYTGTGIPTQLAHPEKATARTATAVIVASIIGLGAIAPQILEILQDIPGMPDGYYATLITHGATVIAITSGITRLMQIPKINELLIKIGLGTGVEKEQ